MTATLEPSLVTSSSISTASVSRHSSNYRPDISDATLNCTMNDPITTFAMPRVQNDCDCSTILAGTYVSSASLELSEDHVPASNEPSISEVNYELAEVQDRRPITEAERSNAFSNELSYWVAKKPFLPSRASISPRKLTLQALTRSTAVKMTERLRQESCRGAMEMTNETPYAVILPV